MWSDLQKSVLLGNQFFTSNFDLNVPSLNLLNTPYDPLTIIM